MKFVSWNIRQGGGSKAEQIVQQLFDWNPDAVGLCEFQNSAASQKMAKELRQIVLTNQMTTESAKSRGKNFLFFASKAPVEMIASNDFLDSSGRWIHVKIGSLNVMQMHVPNRKMPNKSEFLDEVVRELALYRDHQTLAFGDTNSARSGIDGESNFFKSGCEEELWFERIAKNDWHDLWRKRNPDARRYTWYSPHNNGFRLDQLFATKSAEPLIENVEYCWGGGSREDNFSDHAAILFEAQIS